MSSRHIPRKVGLALGSGAARGWAHVGVIEALMERGVEVECVAGTSMGALVGAVYASGKIEVFADVVRRLDWQQVFYHFFEVSFPRSGLIDGTKIADFVRRYVQASDIKNLPVPFRAVATDLMSGSEVVIDEGDVIEAVRASIAIPGIFTPVNRKGRFLVDGGLVNPVPVSEVRKMGAEFVVAVDVSRMGARKKKPARGFSSPERKRDQIPEHGPAGDLPGSMLRSVRHKIEALDETARAYIRQLMKDNAKPGMVYVLGNSIRIVEAQIAETRLKIEPPDILIRPMVGHLGFMDFHHAEEAVAEGRRAMEAEL